MEGTHLDMLWGLMVGFFVGIIILFWIKEQGLFTRRQQMGIIVGMLLNISFGILVGETDHSRDFLKFLF
jgi:hypothetical protein